MSTFNLKVVAPDRQIMDEPVEGVIARTTSGDVGILRGHTDYVAPLAIGSMTVTFPDKKKRVAAIAGGLIKVSADGTTILTSTCEWADEIDLERAKMAEQRARNYIENPTETHTIDLANLKLKRALNRIYVKTEK